MSLVVGIIAAITVVVSVVIGFASIAASMALREFSDSPAGRGVSARIHTSLIDDGTLQLNKARAALKGLGLDQGTRVFRTVQTAPLTLLQPPNNQSASLALSSWDVAGDHVQMREGRLPQTDREAALSVDSSTQLSLRLGQKISVRSDKGNFTLTLVGTFEPDQVAKLVLEPISATTFSAAQARPALEGLATPAAFDAGNSSVKVSWTILPDPASISFADLPKIIAGLGQLQADFINDPQLGSGGAVLTDSLTPTLQQAVTSTEAVSGIIPVALIFVVLLSSIAVTQTGRLLASSRTFESGLLRSRGLSTASAAGLIAAEAAPIALVGSIIGYLAALGCTSLLMSSAAESRASWWSEAQEIFGITRGVPVAVFVISCVLLVSAGLSEFLGTTAFFRSSGSGRRRTVASFGILVLVMSAATLSLWQFYYFGSPLSREAGGSFTVNPLAVGAPALVLMALTSLVLVLCAFLAKLVDHEVSASRNVPLVFSIRQISRRIRTFAVPVALLAATAAATTFAGYYSQTYNDALHTRALLANGSDLNVRLASGTIAGPDDVLVPGLLDQQPGVRAVSDVYTAPIDLGMDSLELVAVNTYDLPGLLAGVSGSYDVQSLGRALTPEAGSHGETALPAETNALKLTLEIDARNSISARAIDLKFWLDGPAGLVPINVAQQPIPAGKAMTTTLNVPLPSGIHAAYLAAVDLLVSSDAPKVFGGQQTITVRLTALDAIGGTRERLPSNWKSVDQQSLGLAPAATPLQPVTGGNTVTVPTPGGQGQFRLVPSGMDSTDELPVVVTKNTLRVLNLRVGDPITLRPPGRIIPTKIVAATDTLPGTTANLAVMADLPSLQRFAWARSTTVMKSNHLWISASDPHAAAPLILAAVKQSTLNHTYTEAVVTAVDDNLTGVFTGPATVALWIGAAASLLLTVVALWASVLTLSAERRSEVGILRALGMSARDQGRGRRRELLTTGFAAIGLGILSGILVSVMTVPILVRTALADLAGIAPVDLAVAFLPLLILLSAEVALVIGTASFYGARVRRQAKTALPVVEAA
ncbi:ABC transporter permease [Arthrobacter sp. ok362]|uniref:ABC transporter permease n=1 Tax=Arthrobacter sp. ok362 TaxID=1761745 RepID=UPI001587FBAC|nr:ABC transporter permease [Arthrobacter sp. ok362]